MNTVSIGNFKAGDKQPLVLLAGRVLEGFERSLEIGRGIKEITQRLGIPYVFKASLIKQTGPRLMDSVGRDSNKDSNGCRL